MNGTVFIQSYRLLKIPQILTNCGTQYHAQYTWSSKSELTWEKEHLLCSLFSIFRYNLSASFAINKKRVELIINIIHKPIFKNEKYCVVLNQQKKRGRSLSECGIRCITLTLFELEVDIQTDRQIDRLV